MLSHGITHVKRGPHGRVPPPGTAAGDQARDELIAAVLAITGDTRLFYLPKHDDTTSTVDASRNARTITYDSSVVGRTSALGSGVQVDFNGDDGEADTPDVPNLSFGDGSTDLPFSLLWLGTPDSDTSAQTLISKENASPVDEWALRLSSSNTRPTFNVHDASASSIISRSQTTALGTSVVLIAATYDGSTATPGINIYKDGALVDNATGSTTGTYTAMENTASLVRLGCRYTTNEEFYNGKMALAMVVAKELSIDEVWELKAIINGFYDLAL